jgi:dihydroflavonol-4-reductase
VIVNPTGIVGPVDYGPSRLNRVLLMAARGRLPLGIGGGFDLVDVRDVALGLRAAAERGRTGENYLIAGHFVEFMDALRLAAKLNGRRGPRWAFPQSMLGKFKRNALIGPTVDMLTSPRVDGSKARRELGHQPRPIAETISDLVASFRASGRMRAAVTEGASRWV